MARPTKKIMQQIKQDFNKIVDAMLQKPKQEFSNKNLSQPTVASNKSRK